MLVNLPPEEQSLQILEWEIIELKDLEIALDPPGVFILFQFSLSDFTVKIPSNFVQETGDVMCEKIDEFVENGSASEIVDAQKLKNSHQFIRVEVFVVQLFFQVVDDLKKVPLEMVVVGERLLPFGQGPEHVCQFLDHNVIALLLIFFESLDSFIVRGVEQEVARNAVRV
jgi:hypothetical protein